jgi:hypothetical protein
VNATIKKRLKALERRATEWPDPTSAARKQLEMDCLATLSDAELDALIDYLSLGERCAEPSAEQRAALDHYRRVCSQLTGSQ